MPVSSPQIWILDDEPQVRESLDWLLQSVGWHAHLLDSPQALLQALALAPPREPGCLLLDVRMPGMSGLDLLGKLRKKAEILPVILLTGHGDVAMAVKALKAGAFDFFEKPFNDQELLDSINRALELHQSLLEQKEKEKYWNLRLAHLTPREREVMFLLVDGLSSKQIADRLVISSKTVDVHRHQVMQKLAVRNLAELIHLSYQLGWTVSVRPGEA
ncbi:response regulator [Marinospirillum sp.]|uniref:response regulator transcription factor n=1 Tax=Marinospirillum sp. TaxID=2183934 RepID=UPI00286FAFB7|nr:response regulator [Marinospirillum sp.]MDR9467587.1 response regulator [Marinospirillum sp.]